MTPTELHFHFHFHLPPISPGPVGGGSGKDAAAEAPGGQSHFQGQAAEQAAAADQAGNEPGSSAPPSATQSEPAPSVAPAGPAEAEESPAPRVASASTSSPIGQRSVGQLSRVCERCAAKFSTAWATKRFCSEGCRVLAQSQRARERAKQAAPQEVEHAAGRVEAQAAASLKALRDREARQAASIREQTKRVQVRRLHRSGLDFETISQRLGLYVEDVRRIVLAAKTAPRGSGPGVSVTADIMGDPPPGRSALDQRRGGRP